MRSRDVFVAIFGQDSYKPHRVHIQPACTLTPEHISTVGPWSTYEEDERIATNTAGEGGNITKTKAPEGWASRTLAVREPAVRVKSLSWMTWRQNK